MIHQNPSIQDKGVRSKITRNLGARLGDVQSCADCVRNAICPFLDE
jgi:hypothetical protein